MDAVFLSGDELATIADVCVSYLAYGIGLGAVMWLVGSVVWLVIQLMKY